ncbi:hypothetical protein [Brevundimonas diminuta]|jgi:hypothetical protein|uniref:hypothetical protein n=1 Tax=Brevundimonas diminuta TaxID=293 RepID=UPI00117849E4|nr:hypothetical protein [Brevundimonas diminuta]WQE45819.1 hypothetical protein U0020_02950 [Brevundimonas diminuta]
MSEELDEVEVATFINRSVSAVNRPLALKALAASSQKELEEIGLMMAGELPASGFVVGVGAPGSKAGGLWSAVLDQTYQFFCTASEEYKKERTQGMSLFEQAVTVISAAIGGTFTLGAGLISGLATVAVLTVFKIGRNAWCQWKAAPSA